MIRTATAIFFCTLLTAFAESSVAEAAFSSAPTISPTPNKRAPLAALLQFEAASVKTTTVSLDDGGRQWEINFDRPPEKDRPLVLLGMRAGKTHKILVTVTDTSGVKHVWSEPLTFTTPPLPTDRYLMPDYKVTVADKDRMEPGFTLLSERRAPYG